MLSKKTKQVLSTLCLSISFLLVGCGSSKDLGYFDIPWEMTTTEFIQNNPEISFGQNNGVNAQTNEYSVELFDTGIYGKMSTYYIDDKLISINVDLNELMNDDASSVMFDALQNAFGDAKTEVNTSGECMIWSNKDMSVTIFTSSSYDHMVNKMYIEYLKF